MEVQVPSDNPYIGQSLGEAGLFHIKGGSLIEMYHYDNVPTHIAEDELIMGGDHLVYAGQIDELIEMAKSHQLVSADHHIFSMSELDTSRQLRTAYVNFGSRLIGKTIGGSTFEKENNLTLTAVARRGERIKKAPREVVLRAGDTLLFLCPKNINVNTTSLKNDRQMKCKMCARVCPMQLTPYDSRGEDIGYLHPDCDEGENPGN